MRIAVVSTDGINVDEHFGKAEKFIIYDIEDAKIAKVEERDTTPLSVGDPDHPFDPDRFEAATKAISDCQKVVVTQIGDVPKSKLKEKGVDAVVFQGAINDILKTF